jgi:GNAT superfamily N-acetyltransferase
MFERCTLETRYRRFHAPVKAIPERYLAEALSGGAFLHAMVACPGRDADLGMEPETGPGAAPGNGGIVALASCRATHEGAAELGILIEDAWQRRGLGTRLLRDLAAHAADAGLLVLEAQLLAEQAWIVGLLRPYGPCRLTSTWAGLLDVTLRLGAAR